MKFSLAIIRFTIIVGNILDSIFKRTTTTNDVVQLTTIQRNAFCCWGRSFSAILSKGV